MLVALIVMNCIWMILLFVMLVFFKGFEIRVNIPEIKINNQPEYMPVEDDIFNAEGDDIKKNVAMDTLDEVLASINSIMYGDDVVEGSKDK